MLLTEKRNTVGRIRFGRQDQEFSFGHVEFEMLSDFQVEMSWR